MSRKKNKISEEKAKYKVNKFKVESAKELGIDLENLDGIESDSGINKSVDNSMYVSIVRSFKKL
jgi:Small, acid-soluble spore proteins, alpha/beta type.